MFARGSLKKLYGPELTEADTVAVCVESLYDAADDDSATGGPDLARKIYPVVVIVTANGFRRVPEVEIGAVVSSVVEARLARPDGPTGLRSSAS